MVFSLSVPVHLALVGSWPS